MKKGEEGGDTRGRCGGREGGKEIKWEVGREGVRRYRGMVGKGAGGRKEEGGDTGGGGQWDWEEGCSISYFLLAYFDVHMPNISHVGSSVQHSWPMP